LKYEYKKHEKGLYYPGTKPEFVTVPKQKFFCIKGRGNPNKEDFSERVAVLYALSYAVRMMPKGGFTPEGYFEYTVYPLEGIWSLSSEGIEKQLKNGLLDKDELEYTIMVRQPEFVSEDTVQRAFEIVKKKKDLPLLSNAYFDEIEDGYCVQIMHLGSYDEEPASFAKMQEFLQEQEKERRSFLHREIYLSDVRKTAPSKQKTVLRYFL
jgi:hypothetical protein